MNILITGATSGIGRALALAYAKGGDKVIACGRSAEKLDQLQRDYADEQASARSASSVPLGTISSCCFDLTDYANYPQLDSNIDLLIFNAGDCQYIDNPVDFDAKAFENVININLISIGYGLQAWLKKLNKGGRLVLVSSSASILPLPRAEAYGSSKAALSYLAKTLAVTLSKHDISVSLVQPGFVDTPLTKRNTFAMPMLIDSPLAADKIRQGIAKGRSEINVPFVFVLVMKCLRLLPSFIWQKLATRMI